MRISSIVGNVLLLCISGIFSLLLLEVLLIFALPHFTQYYIREPNLIRTFRPVSEHYPGIEGDAVFRISSQGLRADELTGDHTLQILTIGGSTTEGVYLDQGEAWPSLLQENLNSELPNEDVWVGNAGKSGESTLQHVLHVRHLREQFPDIDLITVLTGVNDFMKRLEKDDAFEPHLGSVESNRELLETAFSVVPRFSDTRLPFYKRTRIWFMLTKLRFALLSWKDIQGVAGEGIALQRAARHAVDSYINDLPNLTSALDEYRNLLHQTIDEAGDVPIVLITQPSIWRDDLTKKEDDLLLFGWKGPKWDTRGYYSVSALAKGIQMYNDVLIEVCRERDIQCFDLARAIPKDLSIFYDDLHYHEEGSKRIAGIITDYILRSNVIPGY
jgi:lysophospholipase L1-like esterase